MNKIFLPIAITIAIGFSSCKEKATIVIASGAKAADTTYMADVEKQQAKVVLIEEFTGASCAPCPTGHEIIYGATGIKSQHPGQVAVIGYHSTIFPQTVPIHDHSKYDFRTKDANDVCVSVLSIPIIPSAAIDRINDNGVYCLEKEKWSEAVNIAIKKKPAANLYITSSYDAATHNATVKVKVAYTQRVSQKQNITLALIENDIIDAQKKDLDIIDDYKHRSVLRDIITLYYGEAVAEKIDVKEPGRVYERTFTFNVNAAWNADNCELVAFVHTNEGADKEVIQAAEVKLK